MKEKKAGRIIILIAFVVIICLSNVIRLFAGKIVDTTSRENRTPAKKPEMTADSYGTFSSDYTSYYNDNLPFRNNLITLNSAIDYFCFGRPSSDHVAIGTDNWLFYTKKDDGDPIGCYQGTNLFTEDQLNAITQNCMEMRDLIESQGKEFVILIVPNKERIYSEYMPERYGKPADNYGALQIYDHLKTNTDLRVIYPYDELMAAKEQVSENIWYKTDTHWNMIGAYAGASSLMKELGIEMPSLNSNTVTIKAGEETSGDLADMLSLHKQLLFADRQYTVEGYDMHDLKCSGKGFDKMINYHATGADPRSIYIIRDSYATQMADYIGSQFSDTFLRYASSYSYDELLRCDPDIVVYETAERYADRLRRFSIQQ